MNKVSVALEELDKYDGVKDYLASNDLVTKIMPKGYFKDDVDAIILDDVIYLRWGLSKEYKNFITLHEVGHHLMHFGDSYSFNVQVIKNKCEMEANTFACSYLLKNMDLKEINIIDHLMGGGVPKQIAIRFYENMKD